MGSEMCIRDSYKVVQDAQYRRLAAIQSPQWVEAMAHLINSKKPDVFRWHDSGDVQDLDHLKKIYSVCRLTPGKRHWLPTREAWIKAHLEDKPNNLVIRFSAPMVDQAAPESWPNSSEVVTSGASCPAAQQDNECRDCRLRPSIVCSHGTCLLYTSPSPRDGLLSRMPSSA